MDEISDIVFALFFLGFCVGLALTLDCFGRLVDARHARRLDLRILRALADRGPCPLRELLKSAGVETRFVYKGNTAQAVDYQLSVRGLIAYRYDMQRHEPVVSITAAGSAFLFELDKSARRRS